MQECGAPTCLQTKLQVVFGDNENGHGFDKKEESKSNAEWTLASFFQLEVVGRERKKGLTVGQQVKENHLQKNSGIENKYKPLCRYIFSAFYSLRENELSLNNKPIQII